MHVESSLPNTGTQEIHYRPREGFFFWWFQALQLQTINLAQPFWIHANNVNCEMTWIVAVKNIQLWVREAHPMNS